MNLKTLDHLSCLSTMRALKVGPVTIYLKECQEILSEVKISAAKFEIPEIGK